MAQAVMRTSSAGNCKEVVLGYEVWVGAFATASREVPLTARVLPICFSLRRHTWNNNSYMPRVAGRANHCIERATLSDYSPVAKLIEQTIQDQNRRN